MVFETQGGTKVNLSTKLFPTVLIILDVFASIPYFPPKETGEWVSIGSQQQRLPQ